MKTRGRVQTLPGDVYNIPRHSLLWLLVAVVAVILPHVVRMPWWLTLICGVCIAGRVLIYQGRMSFPGRKLKALLVLVLTVLMFVWFGRQIFSTDATVAVLLTGITLKLLEMQRKRDVLLVLYLCYFTIISEFIYSQSIPIAIYMALCVVFITSALMSLNQNPESHQSWRTFRYSTSILLQSVPLMLVFFVLFPRLGPLWSMPLQTASSTTGLSESMAPGDIGNLARSAEVAFRVKFNSNAPPYNQLYWRALTLDEFNGRQWSRGSSPDAQLLAAGNMVIRPWYADIEYLGEPTRYNIILEATNQNWLFTLQMPRINDNRMLMRSDYQLSTQRRITQRFTYDMDSHLEFRAEIASDGREQRRARLIPRQANTRAIAWANELRTSVATDQDFVNAVLQNFRNEEFFYTLSPALLGDNPIDEFLFNTREGFCEHYASAFTFLMRAVGIPARVVTGYMGGEYNPYDGTLTVRQYDAHAWSEIWLPEQGWIRVDPTAAVAPHRIEQGSDAALQEQAEFMQDNVFSLVRFRNTRLINELRYRIEMVDYAWNRFVLNYDGDTQGQLFRRLFGDMNRTFIIFGLLGLLFVMVGITVFFLLRVSATPDKSAATRLYLQFCAQLGRQGFARQPGETPLDFMRRVSSMNPQWRNEIEAITRAYVELAYTNQAEDPANLQALKRQVTAFRLLA